VPSRGYRFLDNAKTARRANEDCGVQTLTAKWRDMATVQLRGVFENSFRKSGA
jgi:hypothetical protein